jgi:hypothetical protein
MSVNDSNTGGPIQPGSPLARALDDYPVPGLSAGFADRVVAAADARAPALPPLRRPASGGRGWRLGRRVVIGAACFGALATAAAATGLLQRFDIPVPSATEVWASITGKEVVAAAPVAPAVRPAAPPATALAPVTIEGPVDTPEELGEAFRRIDEVRQQRRETRRTLTDERIAREIERRRAAGLPVPTPEEEARLRQRIEAAQARREQIVDERVAVRRAEMERKVENGEALTRRDIVQPLRDDQRAAQAAERLEQLRRMTPVERREALRQLPTAERRAVLEAYRARRADGAADNAPMAPEGPAPVETPEAVPTEPEAPQPPL